MLTGIGCAAKVPLQLLKGYEDLPERYKKPYKSRVMKKETGHQSRYALYQNWCPVMSYDVTLDTRKTFARLAFSLNSFA